MIEGSLDFLALVSRLESGKDQRAKKWKKWKSHLLRWQLKLLIEKVKVELEVWLWLELLEKELEDKGSGWKEKKSNLMKLAEAEIGFEESVTLPENRCSASDPLTIYFGRLQSFFETWLLWLGRGEVTCQKLRSSFSFRSRLFHPD